MAKIGRLIPWFFFTVNVFAAGSRFVAVPPCRLVDTRVLNGQFGLPHLVGNNSRSFPLTAAACGLPNTAVAYSLNVTALPENTLSFLTIWPTGQVRPLVSTLNSFDGRVVANAAIVPAGTGGSVDVFATDNTDVIIDVNGYFDSQSNSALPFFTLAPCRVIDTRNAAGPFGGPSLAPSLQRNVPVATSACGLPATAGAYSLNATVVPAGPLGYLTLFPSGQAQPFVSTLNSFDGRITANAAIVPAGGAGAISAFATNTTDLILDANGYFSTTGTGTALSLFPVTPCRVADTRNPAGAFGGPRINAGATRTFSIPQSACGVPSGAKAYALNVTAVPQAGLQFLTIWPADQARPLASTLNSPNGAIVANAAIVPASADGSVSVFVTDNSDVILDINGYFAPAALTDFTLSVDPPTKSVSAGATATYTVSVAGVNGFAGPIQLSLVNPPPGLISATFSPNTVTPPSTSMLSLVTSLNGPSDTFTTTVRGTSAGFTDKSQDIVLRVTALSTQAASVSINNFAFSPVPVTVAPGGQVTWTNNQAGVNHTVTADGGQFGSGTLSTGQTFSTMPTTPGTYTYHCAIHPFMQGSVVVQ